MAELTLKQRRLIGGIIVLLLVVLVGVSVLRKNTGGSSGDEVLPVSDVEPVVEARTLPLPTAQEIALAYSGLSTDTTQQTLVTRVGNHIVSNSDAAKAGAAFRFYVLADQNRINVMAMPDGTIFITTLLLNHLKTEGQLAGMLAHEIGQVIARHTPKYLATGVLVYDRNQESRADLNGTRFMGQAGYNPNAFIDTLMMLRDIHREVPVEFFQTHPSPINRIAHIEYAIKQQFPDGVPASLSE